MVASVHDMGLPYAFAKRHRCLLRWVELDTSSSSTPTKGNLRPFVLCIEQSKDACNESMLSVNVRREIERHFGKPEEIEFLDESTFSERLVEAYRTQLDDDTQQPASSQEPAEDLDAALDALETTDLLDESNLAPVVRLVNALASRAISEGVSDIHIEPSEQQLVIRFRRDGRLALAKTLPPSLSSPLASRIKLMAELDIAERRVPQDGRIALSLGQRRVDLRISTLPNTHGERIVMRILDRSKPKVSLEDLGMQSSAQQAFESAIFSPNGIVLITGPTGSGKTTTLYGALNALNDGTRSILTIEDPVEYVLPGVGQAQVNTKAGMHFANGLKAALRQDPDVIMVGETRDTDTAKTSIQASLTGHLVLSTLHTNSAWGAMARLADMGVEAYLMASSVRLLIAQRLVRRLCPQCKVPIDRPQLNQHWDLATRVTLFEPNTTGCEHCVSGFQGRIALYEMLPITYTLRAQIHDGDLSTPPSKDHYVDQCTLNDRARDALTRGLIEHSDALSVAATL